MKNTNRGFIVMRHAGRYIRPAFRRFLIYWRFGLRPPVWIRVMALMILPVVEPAAAQTEPGPPARPVLQLSLKQAMEIALAPQGNVRVQLALEMIQQTRMRANQARAALLPNLDAAVSGQRQTRSLSASGIQFDTSVPGLSFPEVVGPYNTIDTRATLNQSIFDLSAIRRFQAARKSLTASEAEHENAQEQVAGQVARAYLEALRAEANVVEVKAGVDLAEALLQLAVNQKEAGTGTGIEVTRARVQLSNEQQRLLVAENEQRKAHLRLLKSMDVELDAALALTEQLAFTPLEEITVAQALPIALESRPDLKAQQLRRESAGLNYRATRAERIPSLVGFADYGTVGSTFEDAEETWTVGVSLRIPIFDGGRRDARRAENLSLMNQEQLRQSDLREQIELEVRLALEDLQSAREQVQVAEQGLDLAQGELSQARRRYQTGITGSVEVTDAQTRLARARDNRVAALFNYNLARINLAQALGTIRQMIGYSASTGRGTE